MILVNSLIFSTFLTLTVIFIHTLVLLQEFIENLHDLHEEWLLGPQSANLPAPVVVSTTSSHLSHS